MESTKQQGIMLYFNKKDKTETKRFDFHFVVIFCPKYIAYAKILQYVTQRQLCLTERLQIYIILTTDLLLPVREYFLKFLPVPCVKRFGTTDLE